MNLIKEWAVSLCGAAVLGAIIKLITPTGSYEKIIRLVVGALMVGIVFSPLLILKDTKIELEAGISQKSAVNTELRDTVIGQTESLVKSAVESSIMSILSEKNIEAEQFTVVTNTSPEGGISIERVELHLENSVLYNVNLEDEIYSRTGINVVILPNEE